MRTLLLLLALLSGITLQAQVINTSSSVKSDWIRLSEVVAGFDKNSAAMDVSPIEKFISVHFRVTEAQVELRSAVIYFENGERQAIKLNTALKPDETSRIFYLKGGNRIIKKVTFQYRKLAHTDENQAKVEFWASKLKKSTIE